MRYIYNEVTKTPAILDEGIVYHNSEFELASLLCACGCGHKVTLLVPDGHHVTNDNDFATITPSIGVFDAPCKSHYFITNGHVRMLTAFSNGRATSVMRAQIARHVAHNQEPVPWLRRFADKAKQLWKQLLG
jgi:hypothetical protein